MREIPFSSIQFPIYERLKARSLIKKRELDIVDSIVNGGLAGGVAAFCTTPCDVVKSKLMT
jgi:solute carrier family 25 S-adenosylmethionine transporter 26